MDRFGVNYFSLLSARFSIDPFSVFYENPLITTFEGRLAKRTPLYGRIHPARQWILGEGGSPIVDEQKFRQLFGRLLVDVKK